MYTLVVGTKNWSSWSLRPYLALRHIGAPFEEVYIQLRRKNLTGDEIKRHSPAGRVPILKINDGARETIVWDSLAICETLAERHSEAKLWPDDPLVRAEARSYAAEMHSGFADVRDQLSMDFARRVPLPPLRDTTKTQITRIIDAWASALARFGKDGGFLFGRFSIADCMYGPVASRFTTYGVQMPAPVKAYAERMMALPAMKDWGAAAQKEVDAGLA
ncbi:MAG: glutathione S-transferase family protein [Alphaproteobacteria bacterium]|nr:glutathione S-transferase family protein [Alphaproteobacteria bacterium]MBV9419788.1 glutathione S-transferase family protein [Alphaproteobacteria bacterium]MBV9542703.1 glutathione S-transferase family protein [Alphaproteobacteria bacterium]MBV9905213.1 glutathione S-transferase family protein [Alphaproteobacteria bacterium]